MTPPTPVQERVLVLCRAIPEESTKYGTVVCCAGLTDGGEFRRLYPVPFHPFRRGGGIPFHKKQWITASLQPPEARDKRAESRKIDMKSIVAGVKVDDDEVRGRIQKVRNRGLFRSIRHSPCSSRKRNFVPFAKSLPVTESV